MNKRRCENCHSHYPIIHFRNLYLKLFMAWMPEIINIMSMVNSMEHSALTQRGSNTKGFGLALIHKTSRVTKRPGSGRKTSRVRSRTKNARRCRILQNHHRKTLEKSSANFLPSTEQKTYPLRGYIINRFCSLWKINFGRYQQRGQVLHYNTHKTHTKHAERCPCSIRNISLKINLLSIANSRLSAAGIHSWMT